MKITKAVLLSLSFLACNTNSNSFSQNELSPEQIIDEFFDTYASEGPIPALDFILSTNEWIKEDTDKLKNTFQDLIAQIGNYQGKEPIVKRSIGDNYLLWSYMIKYDRQPIRFQFIFYKPSDKWQLQDFRYDDDLENEIIEAAKAYRLLENLPGN